MLLSCVINSALLLLPCSISATPLSASGLFWTLETWVQDDCPTTSGPDYSNYSYGATSGWVDFPASYSSLNFSSSSDPSSFWNLSLSTLKGGGGSSVAYAGSLSCANATGWESYRVDYPEPAEPNPEEPEMQLIAQELRSRV
jgi:hypothetical protein